MLDDLGLATRLLDRPHGRLQRMTLRSGDTSTVLGDFSRLRTRFPFIAMIPQAEFLEFIVNEAKTYSCFDVRMGSRVTDLIIEEDGDGLVRGVRYRDDNGEHELRAQLTVAADGHSSHVRTLAGFETRPNAAAMDVMWVVLPRKDDEQGIDLTGFRVGHGRLVVVLARSTEWQLGYVILKGSRHTVKEAGLAALRTEVASLVPELADRVHTIDAWTDIHTGGCSHPTGAALRDDLLVPGPGCTRESPVHLDRPWTRSTLEPKSAVRRNCEGAPRSSGQCGSRSFP